MARQLTHFSAAILWLGCICLACAAEPDSSTATPNSTPSLFAAMEQDLLDVRYIPLGADKANVFVKNQTKNDLVVELPKAFGARHINPQPGGGFGNQQFGNQQFGGGGGTGQQLGGGFGNQGGGGQGFGNQGFGQAGIGNQGGGQGFNQGFGNRGGFNGGFNQGGFFRVPAGQTRKLIATTVCLEFGKPDPNPRMTYELVPIDRVTEDRRIVQLCSSLTEGKIRQSAAQAAAWNMANALPWEKIQRLAKTQSRYVPATPMFSAQDIHYAQAAVAFLDRESSSDERYTSLSSRGSMNSVPMSCQGCESSSSFATMR